MKLRVWHIPQVPMKPFIVEVASVEEGVRLMDALADYDAFQYDNNIKPITAMLTALRCGMRALPMKIYQRWGLLIAGWIGTANANVTTTHVNISKA